MKTILNGQEYDFGWAPALHRVVVLPAEVEEKSQGGIILQKTDVMRDRVGQIEALVVAVGPTAWKDQIESDVARPGDTVLFSKHAGYLKVGNDGREYRIINDLDLVAVKDREE